MLYKDKDKKILQPMDSRFQDEMTNKKSKIFFCLKKKIQRFAW